MTCLQGIGRIVEHFLAVGFVQNQLNQAIDDAVLHLLINTVKMSTYKD